MGFSRAVKEQILVDTARHCCICHRYKGVKVEVHHIKQQADGGANTYKNAIALCFDCHADAGHYNPRHPRGTKFSPTELRKAKDSWLSIVSENNIQTSTEPDKLLCRYYVFEDYETLVNISNGDLSGFPVENALLLRNEVTDSISRITAKHPHIYRHASTTGETFKDKNGCLDKYPEASIPDKSKGMFSYFETIRSPTMEECEEIKLKDGLCHLMINESLPIKDTVVVGGYYEGGCLGDGFQEDYIFRKLWGAFIAVTNIYDRPLTLESIVGSKSINQNFSRMSVLTDEIETISLPKAPIEPGSTVLVPIALILPPLYSLNREEWSSFDDGNYGETIQVVTHGSIILKNIDDCMTYGPQICPTKVKYKLAGNTYSQDVHEFDLTNMYTVAEHLNCGSCPHLFFEGDKISYGRELLAHCDSNIGKDSFGIPPNVHSIIIAEIEDETTEIVSIKINGEIYAENIILVKTDFIKVPVSPGSIVKIIGQYIPNHVVNFKPPQGTQRNNIVGNFLYNLNAPSNEFNKLSQYGALRYLK